MAAQAQAPASVIARPVASNVYMQVQAVRVPQEDSSQINVKKVKFLDTKKAGEEEEEAETSGIFHTNTPVKASKELWTTTMMIGQVL